MRARIDAGGLLALPSPDLSFRTPVGVGFLSKHTGVELATTKEFAVLTEYSTSSEKETSKLLASLEAIAASAKEMPDILTYWALKWLDAQLGTNILVFERYTSREAYDNASRSVKIANFDQPFDRTTWVGTGVGFVRGVSI